MADFGPINDVPMNPWTTFYQSQEGSNRSIAAQQDMADRATLRDLAPGLTTRDPAAIGAAASIPVGMPAVGALGNYDASAAASKLAALEFGLKMPGDLGAPVGGGAPAAGASGTPSGSTGSFVQGKPFTPANLPADISPDEDAMVRTVAGEAGTQPLAGQIGVASVIKNRSASAGVSPQDVVFSPQQFSPWNGGEARARLERMQPSDPAYQSILNNVVRPVLAGKVADPTKGATHFYAPAGMAGGAPPSWAVGQTPSAVIGGHQFYSLGYGPAASAGAAPAGAPASGFGPLASVPGAPAVAPAAGAEDDDETPARPAAAPAPVIPPDGHDHDHAISVAGGLMQAILDAPADQHAALWDKYRPIMLQAGAVNAPVAYPGDAVAGAMRDSAFNPQARAAHLAAIPGAGGAPAVAGAAPPAGLPGGVQVAGPGAPGSPVSPQAASDSAASAPPAPPPHAPTGEGAPTPVAAPVAAPVVAPAAPPPVPNENALLASAAPVEPSAAAAPSNALLPPPPVAAPPAPRPTFMPSASAVPPPSAVPPAQPASRFDPPPGARMQLSKFGTPFPGAPPGMALYQVPGVPGLQPFRNPAEAEPVEFVTKDGLTHQIGRITGREVAPPIPVGNDARQVAVPVQGGTQMYQSGHPVGAVIPYSGRPEQADAYKSDIPRAAELSSAAQNAQMSMPRLNEMAELIPQIASGGTAPELRAKAAAIMEGWGVSPETIKSFTGMPGGAAAQLLSKLAISTAGAAAKVDVGSNNGIQSTQLYQSANPGMLLLPDANKRVTNMLRVAAQFPQDYAQGALQHFGTNELRFLHGGDYAPLTLFNRAWLAQANPQIGAAAIGILNGDPFESWSAKVTPAQASQAAAMVARIDPATMVPMRGGSMRPVSEVLAHPAAAAVVTPRGAAAAPAPAPAAR